MYSIFLFKLHKRIYCQASAERYYRMFDKLTTEKKDNQSSRANHRFGNHIMTENNAYYNSIPSKQKQITIACPCQKTTTFWGNNQCIKTLCMGNRINRSINNEQEASHPLNILFSVKHWFLLADTVVAGHFTFSAWLTSSDLVTRNLRASSFCILLTEWTNNHIRERLVCRISNMWGHATFEWYVITTVPKCPKKVRCRMKRWQLIDNFNCTNPSHWDPGALYCHCVRVGKKEKNQVK